MQYCVVLWLLFSSALTAPADQPVRVDLPVYGVDTDLDADIVDTNDSVQIVTLKSSDAKVFSKSRDAKVLSKSSDAKVSSKGSDAKVFSKSSDAKVFSKGSDAKVISKSSDAKVFSKGSDAKVFSNSADAQVVASNAVKLVEPLEPENPPGDDRRDRTLVTNLLAHKVQTASDVLKNRLLHSPPPHSAGFLSHPYPLTKLESALIESEGLGSRKLSLKDNLHHFMAENLHSRPLIDTISEDEKYGNSGERFTVVGKAIVGGAEIVSSIVNSVLEVPGAIFRSISRAATEKLNALGGKLIGL